jgi:hypothetical protein
MFRTLLVRGKFFAKLPKSILASSNDCETWWSCSWCQYEAIEYLTCSCGHVYHPMSNFVYLRSSRLKDLHFWLDSCIVNKREKFELEMACWMHLEGFQVVSTYFWALVYTGLTGRGHRSDWSECWSSAHVEHRSDRWWWPVWPVRAKLLQLPCFKCCFACIRPWGVACVQGELFVVFRAFVWLFALVAWTLFCLGCVEPLPLPKGSETCLLQVILLFTFVWLLIACWSFFLFVSFLFSFLSCYFMWVLSMHSSRGRLRTMCSSRTGGWSLPCVMSDWQHCVDWFLAKYYWCRLRLDWCWWRWRTSAKGRRRWGLQVWRRQGGFVRGTR